MTDLLKLGIATRYGLDGWGIESQSGCGDDMLCTFLVHCCVKMC